MPRTMPRLIAVGISSAVAFFIFASSAGADPLWAPSHRYGPQVLRTAAERWDGYDTYDGYFWMYHGFRWNERELGHFRSDPILSKGIMSGVYEFRRVKSTSYKEGAPEAEHWDGAWGRNTCLWFIICLGDYVQSVYTEYVTSLPRARNSGLEEYDGWFSEVHGVSSSFPYFVPPSYYFDFCTVAERLGGGGVCDEEYEILFDPYQLIPNRYYHVAIKFRTDSNDGSEPTRWITKFEIEEPSDLIPYAYKSHYLCEVDYGAWQIDYASTSGYREVEAHVPLGRCVDFDSDGLVDDDDICPRIYDPAQTDSDGDGTGDYCDDNPLIHRDDIDGDGAVGGDDNCPQVFNPDQADYDGDGRGDACDVDDDGDGMVDASDAFPLDPTEWLDSDSDGIGDNLDDDDDGDGYADEAEVAAGSDPLNPFSIPPPPTPPESLDDDGDGVPNGSDAFPADPTEWSDNDRDGIGDNADTDDDNDCYPDVMEGTYGTSSLNPGSKPPDYDGDCNPNDTDPDDDNDNVADLNDVFPFDSSEWADNDNDGVGNNADVDDDGDGMPDAWETTYGFNPLDPSDGNGNPDQDAYSNYAEFYYGTNPRDFCSPPQIEYFCYDFTGAANQCGGTMGVNCVPVGQQSPSIRIETDDGGGGCQISFALISSCGQSDMEFCIDFRGDSPTADLGQCQNYGTHCAAVNEWTDPIGLDMDGRGGWCTEQFFIRGSEPYTFYLNFWPTEGVDANGQCKNVGVSKAFSAYDTGTDVIGLDTDNRTGGCWQDFTLRHGTWSVMAF